MRFATRLPDWIGSMKLGGQTAMATETAEAPVIPPELHGRRRPAPLSRADVSALARWYAEVDRGLLMMILGLIATGLLAIAAHRLAHELYRLQVPIIPRVMSEWIHTKTGTDIHPGARIGRAFFIDHATGVVIGETTEIGDHVKLYQGVTLGARSFALGLDGTPVKHVKRHPTVRDDVIIYAHATILGGETVIGARSVVGSNVFLMESVPPDSVVSSVHPELTIREKKRAKKT